MAANMKTIAERLHKAGVSEENVKAYQVYLHGAMTSEKSKPSDKRPVSRNTDDELVGMYIKWHNLGVPLNGTDVVITGKNMSMATYHGFKNKVKRLHPTAKFDIQLVREGDTFKMSREDGKTKYKHDIDDAFSQKPIIGAYCFITIDDITYPETLNAKDYMEMQKASKQDFLWKKWASEFWLKSVIKRACKRHFYDEVAEIDKIDNEEYGLRDELDEAAVASVTERINGAKTLAELKAIQGELTAQQAAATGEAMGARITALQAEAQNAAK